MEKELQILNAIQERDVFSQRELADKTGFSLGAVNVLIKKMVREGLVKIEKIPPRRVAYMLTPEGMREKFRKTCSYIKIHYAEIERMGHVVDEFASKLEPKTVVHVSIQQNELAEMVNMMLMKRNIQMTNSMSKADIIISDYDEAHYNSKWINLFRL